MIHEVIPVGPLQCNCSIFGDEATHEAIVIDPGDNIAQILGILQKHALKVNAIIITHAHIDHIGGAAKLKAATGAPVHMNANDAPLYNDIDSQAAWLGIEPPERTAIDVNAQNGQVLKLADKEFHILHTPGHTQGSISVWIPEENKLIAGDTLFRDSIGRTDLPGGDFAELERSIRTQIYTLPPATVVYPGHGPATTVGDEKSLNPFVRG